MEISVTCLWLKGLKPLIQLRFFGVGKTHIWKVCSILEKNKNKDN